LKFDVDGLTTWADVLDEAEAEISTEVAKVTGMACNNMKKDAQRRVRGYRHLPHLARSFTYDVKKDRDQGRRGGRRRTRQAAGQARRFHRVRNAHVGADPALAAGRRQGDPGVDGLRRQGRRRGSR
jgi:hypothetical protein